MSIINDALKKARRESVDAPPTYTGDSSAIHPQRRTSSKPSTWIVLPILLLVLFSIALSIVLGYLAYQEFYLKKDPEKTAPSEVPTSPTTPQPETKSPADKPPPHRSNPRPSQHPHRRLHPRQRTNRHRKPPSILWPNLKSTE